jgi:hypothetical protein
VQIFLSEEFLYGVVVHYTKVLGISVCKIGMDSIENTASDNVLYCCVRVCCRGTVCIEPLSRNRQ